MVKQLITKNIRNYLAKNPNCILLDVRTKEEWIAIGKPDGDKISLKTYFLEIKRDSLFNFIKEFKMTKKEIKKGLFKSLNIKQDKEILVLCKSGERSQITAELLSKENYRTTNISDGFEGSAEGVGWIKNQLPIYY